jgi:hypothetical protein
MLCLGLLVCWTGPGCDSVPQNGQPDPLVEEIVRQAGPKKKATAATAGAEALKRLILEEIPLQTPVAEARAVMERHGFSCWANVPDEKGPCHHCTAYRRKGPAVADKVVVKLFAEQGRVSNVEVAVEHDVFQVYSTPYSPTPNR